MRQIVVMLLMLADLAERAASASPTARALTLWWLQQADIVAKEFVTGPRCDTTGRRWSPSVLSVHYGDDPDDAMRLALSLRLLARAVQCLVLHTGCRPGAFASLSTDRTGRGFPSSLGFEIQAIPLGSDVRIDTS